MGTSWMVAPSYKDLLNFWLAVPAITEWHFHLPYQASIKYKNLHLKNLLMLTQMLTTYKTSDLIFPRPLTLGVVAQAASYYFVTKSFLPQYPPKNVCLMITQIGKICATSIIFMTAAMTIWWQLPDWQLFLTKRVPFFREFCLFPLWSFARYPLLSSVPATKLKPSSVHLETSLSSSSLCSYLFMPEGSFLHKHLLPAVGLL